jgi:hypothetical protein
MMDSEITHPPLNRLADIVVRVLVRNLGELPNFLVLNSGTESFGNSSIFTFFLTTIRFVQFMYFHYGIVIVED